MTLKTFFPLIWDSTQLAQAKACQTSFFRNHVQHLNGEESTDLIAGAAFAEGIHTVRREFFTHGQPLKDALLSGIEALYVSYGDHIPRFKENKSPLRMALALESYFNEYDPEHDDFAPVKLEGGNHAMEYNMLAPIVDLGGKVILHPELGLPLLFNGRLDLLANYAGEYWMVDEKTTAGYFTENWVNSWNMRDQFTAYAWLGQQSSIPQLQQISKIMIRGISLPKSRSKDPNTIDAFYADIGTIKHQTAPTYRTQFMIDNWHLGMANTIRQLTDAYSRWKVSGEPFHRFFTKAGGEHCVAYSRPCRFTESCMNPNEEKYLEVEEQYIWRPDLAKRQRLEDFLSEMSL